MDIAAFLTARLDEDEHLARMASRTSSGRVGGHWKLDCKCVGLCSDQCDEERIEGDNMTIYSEGGHDNWQAQHIVRHDPVRVLAEIAAKRTILAIHSTPHTVVDGFCVEEGGDCTHAGENRCEVCGHDECLTLRLLATPYADHPDYDPAWAVDAPHREEG